jgi:hypothetical protein
VCCGLSFIQAARTARRPLVLAFLRAVLTRPARLSCTHARKQQVLTLTAVVMPNEDLAFMGAIAWTAINLLLSNFMVRYVDMTNRWLSYLR